MILTLDLGTTRLKVAVFAPDGTLLGQVAIRHREYTSEADAHRWQSADDWWADCIVATSRLWQEYDIDPKGITGCSLSGRAGAGVFVDEAGDVLVHPWSDTRHIEHLRRLLKGRDRSEVAMYGATLLSKFLWLRDMAPDVADKIRYALYAKDFLLYRLSGEAVTDPASGPDALAWDQALLSECDVPAAILPRPALPWTIAGQVIPSAAEALGINSGIPVATGAHDGICANAGAGAISPGQYCITLGTHAVVRAVSDVFPPGALRFYGFPPDKHIIGGNALMAGRSLDWFLDNWFDAPEDGRQTLFAELDQKIGGMPPGAGGVSFLPFLSGQIAPERRPAASATFHGLRSDTTREAMYRAVMEGASFALTRIFEQIVAQVGQPRSVGLTGGGANSRVWTQMLTDLLGQTLDLTDGASEGRGAALFCSVAMGSHGTLEDAAADMIRSRQVSPGDDASTWPEVRRRWQTVYDALSTLDGP